MLERITPFAISGILLGVFSTGFGLFVFFKSRDRRLARLWLLFSLSAAGWGFGSFWIGTTLSPHSTLVPYRIAYLFGVIWIAPFFYHFIRIFLNQRTRFVPIQYVIGTLFAVILPTPIFFQDRLCVVRTFQAPIGGIMYPVFFIWWIGLILYSHFLLYRAYYSVDIGKRMQIGYFFFATAIAFSGGTLCYLPSFNIRVYPWGNFTTFLYPIIMTYAMLKYQLLEVRVFLRRVALLIGVYVVLLIVDLPVTMLIHSMSVKSSAPVPLQFFEVITMATLLSLGPFLYAYVARHRAYFKEHTMAGLTHELKSPLATMDSALEIFSTRISHKLTADDLSYLEMLKKNRDRLNSYVNNLLKVYKVEGESSLTLDDVDIYELVQATVQSFESQLQLKNIILKVERDPNVKTVRADEDKLRLVISNVLSNAIKFTDDGGISIRLATDGRKLTVTIIDSGVGLNASELPYIFDRFYQGRAAGKNQGSGIGLTIAKAWVEDLGGIQRRRQRNVDDVHVASELDVF